MMVITSIKGGKLPPFFLVLIVLALSACTSPSLRLEEQAIKAGLVVRHVRAAQLPLLTIEQPGEGTHARVYIEGDGRPWIRGGYQVAIDPSPENPFAFYLMRQDGGPCLYLGRPCYFSNAQQEGCHPVLWTSARYGLPVLESMTSALEQWLVSRPQIQSVTLVGHSGGGVLALLIGERVTKVRAVVALAAPVDIDIWTELHHYSQLALSLNPVKQSFQRRILRTLVFADADTNVPPAVFREVAKKIPNARVLVLLDEDHRCCRATNWQAFIRETDQLSK